MKSRSRGVHLLARQMLPVYFALLGLLFIIAAVGKLRDPAGFVRLLQQHAVIPQSLVAPSAFGIPYAEFLLAIVLLYAIYARKWSPLAVACTSGALAAFTVYLISVLAWGHPDASCLCFGRFMDFSIRGAIARNALLLAALIGMALTAAAAPTSDSERLPSGSTEHG